MKGPYHADWVARVKRMCFRRWNPEEQAWIIPYTSGVLAELLQLFDGIALSVDDALLEESELLADYEWKVATCRVINDRIRAFQLRWGEASVRDQAKARRL
ncbi:hypothetical protein [Cohnella panacarvi]|uniref:hypothetical protein n=1 Tax=Cohnella panacarvi TaxID=400776 RepID=UPI0004B31828|nr:hypothetical protein [Cohnella panacarvi]